MKQAVPQRRQAGRAGGRRRRRRQGGVGRDKRHTSAMTPDTAANARSILGMRSASDNDRFIVRPTLPSLRHIICAQNSSQSDPTSAYTARCQQCPGCNLCTSNTNATGLRLRSPPKRRSGEAPACSASIGVHRHCTPMQLHGRFHGLGKIGKPGSHFRLNRLNRLRYRGLQKRPIVAE